ncbi:MAG: M48 family metalloprotease, partial [Ilumatobacter sp.]
MDNSSLDSGRGPAKISGFGSRMALLVGTNIAVIALFTLVASIFGIDPRGLVGITIMAALFGFGGSFISLAMSKKLAIRSTGARVIEHPANDAEKWLVDMVERLSRDAGIEMPDVAIFDSPQPNAFATGAKRNDSLVAVSMGLLETMTAEQVEAVMAHEIAHGANRYTLALALVHRVGYPCVRLRARVVAY